MHTWGRTRQALLALTALLACACLPSHPPQPLDSDDDGIYAGFDCDDANGTVSPDRPEICDGEQLDNDCDDLPDGANMPVLDPFGDGLDGSWEYLAGSAEDLEEVEELDGYRIAGAPVAVGRDLGAECWQSYTLTIGWAFEDQAAFEAASFVLELTVMAGQGWDAEQLRPTQGYLMRWERDGDASVGLGSSYTLLRLSEDGEERLLYASHELDAAAYAKVPEVVLQVRQVDDSTDLSVKVSQFLDSAPQGYVEDDSPDRWTAGGVVLAVKSASDGVLTGAWLEQR